MSLDPELAEWLVDGDPALRWQVERDLLDAPESRWRATRQRVATEGFGARLLAHQDADGQWAGGAYFPQGPDWPQGDDGSGQPWVATTWSLNALREWGLDAAVLAGTAERLAANSRWEYDDLPYWGGEVDCCINGYTLANGVWLGADVSGLAGWFLEHQLADGGWNCAWVDGSTRSSFHSTLNSVRGLLAYEIGADPAASPDLDLVRAARHRGEEYLLERRLMVRKSTGEPVGPWVTHFAYPFRWLFTGLNAAEHFRTAGLHDRTAPDPRLQDVIASIRGARQADGRWLQGDPLPGRVWFEVDAPSGQPSRWLTLYALRVLRWFDRSFDEASAGAARMAG